LWLSLIFGCTTECDGIGCNADDVNSSLLFFLTVDEGLTTRDPTHAALEITGQNGQGSNWGLIAEEDQLLVSAGDSSTIHSFPFQIGKKTLSEYEFYQGEAKTDFGRELLKHNQSAPYYLVTSPKTDREETIQQSGSLFIYDDTVFDNPRNEFYSIHNGDVFPSKVWLCGDIDGDGIEDWMASKINNSSASGGLYKGEVIIGLSEIWYGLEGPINISTLPSLTGSEPGEGFGHVVDCQHDLNGNGIVDVMISSPFADGTRLGNGKITIFVDGFENTPIEWVGVTEQGWFGYSFALGDLTGDGDLEISTFSFADQEGQIKIWSAQSILTQPSSLISLRSDQPLAFFGKRQSIVDIDGDLKEELLVAAPFFSSTLTETGALFIYKGTEELENWEDPEQELVSTIVGSKPYQRLGGRFWYADIDGDNRLDLITQILQ
jgi:hypothetical protein